MKRLAFLGVLVALFGGPAAAQNFPSRDIRFLNGFPAGGTSDLLGRLLAEQFSRQLGKTVVVDNKAGASGMIAAAEAAKAAPDGHTILLASMAMLTVVPQMVKTSIDVDKDLTTIGNVASVYGTDAASPLLPEVPVISRTGLKDFVIHNWFGMVGPAGLSPELVTRWDEELAKAVATPELQQKFADNGLQIVAGSKEQFDREIAADRAKWGKLIRDFNIKPEN
jgi:tripartite-type tricarboxylate transporter receptor subunit TctC